MKRMLRHKPTPATLISLLALAVALGGTAYSAAKINGRTITLRTVPGKALKKRSVGSTEVARHSLSGKHIKDGGLTAIQMASTYTTSLRLRCPPKTVELSGACMETRGRLPPLN